MAETKIDDGEDDDKTGSGDEESDPQDGDDGGMKFMSRSEIESIIEALRPPSPPIEHSAQQAYLESRANGIATECKAEEK
jgi:hypothetical protein